MKIVQYLLLLVLVVSVVNSKRIRSEDEYRKEFLKYQSQYNKLYSSSEYTQKYLTFKSNIDRIDQLNSKSKLLKSSTVFAINEFADLSKSEFKQYYLNSQIAIRDPNAPVAEDIPMDIVKDIPASFDWRTKGAVTPVKNQGQCGSCWSFSTTGNVEGQWFLANNSLVGLSEQNLVDCSNSECMEYLGTNVCNDGCGGGLQPNAYNYIIKNDGIDTESAYPYTATQSASCEFKPNAIGAKISNWTYVSSDETQMAAYLVQNGPLAIAADAEEWQFYSKGVFDFPCGKVLDHGILIVGYGVESSIFKNKPYWIVKNSWGATWGEAGYLRVERGVGECGLNVFVTSSKI
eukprot:gene5532-6891_t